MQLLGDKSIIGQQKIRNELSRILESDRLGHAYLLAGPPGIGKKALALAFAEAINGVENLSTLGDKRRSEKSSWLAHPDIHVFIPMPKSAPISELKERLQLLAEDPYAIIDYGSRPTLSGESDSKNRNAFYNIDYFRETIRPVLKFKPNEGRRTIVILSNVEYMLAQSSNAFLKILEEPGDNLMFILTTDRYHSLLPTITSRCQILRCNGLTTGEIREALIQKDQLSEADAAYLARISGGNFSSTRIYDINTLRERRKQIVQFLRAAYTQDATEIAGIASEWAGGLNLEGHMATLNLLEAFIRDLSVYKQIPNEDLITNADQLEVISKFTGSLSDARLDEMIAQLNSTRKMFVYNTQPKLIYTVLAMRFSYLMRGLDTPLPASEPWLHMPAV